MLAYIIESWCDESTKTHQGIMAVKPQPLLGKTILQIGPDSRTVGQVEIGFRDPGPSLFTHPVYIYSGQLEYKAWHEWVNFNPSPPQTD